MKVIILAGGLGTRLREETEYRPKTMVEVGGRPVLWHIMKIYNHYGLNDFVVCLGYKGNMVKEYFYNYEVLNNDFTVELGKGKAIEVHGDSSENGWKITLADTGENSLKGARLKKVERYVGDDTFMVTYGDGVADVDIKALLKFHKSHGKLATVTGINPASRFGELKLNGDRVESFSEKPESGSEYINGGFFVFNKGIFDYLSEDAGCDLEVGALERVAKDGELMVYRHEGFWACMDNIRDMDYLNGLWNEDKAKWKVW